MKALLLSVFLLESCANFDEYVIPEEWMNIKISATSSSSSRELAMSEAHKRALVKIDDLGCDQDKGRGDVTYKRMGGAYIAEAVYTISKRHCEKRISCKDEDWALEPNVRSQAGEWRWYRGKGTSINRAEADELAKVEALKHLVSECNLPHKSIRFIERCEDFTSNSFVVMTRASIKHVQCSQSKNATGKDIEAISSPELSRLLTKYK